MAMLDPQNFFQQQQSNIDMADNDTADDTAETKTFSFRIDQLNQNAQYLLGYVQEHPVEFGIISCLIVAGIVTIVVPLAIGFGLGGVVAGSAAAAWQASIGNVVAGSLFATLQSMSATGTLVSVGGALIGSGLGAAAVVAVDDWVKGIDWSKGVDWANSVDWAQGADWNGWAQAAGLEGSEAWKKSKELAGSVDWQGIEEGAGRIANDAVKGTVWVANEVAGWATSEAARGAERWFGGWRR